MNELLLLVERRTEAEQHYEKKIANTTLFADFNTDLPLVQLAQFFRQYGDVNVRNSYE